MTEAREYDRITHLAGRNANGRHSVAHAVAGLTALCGAKPGRKSAGWSEWDDDAVTCPKCLIALSNKEVQGE